MTDAAQHSLLLSSDPATEGNALAKDRPALLPERHPTPDFFVCDLTDAAPKGDWASMEHPLFSLSTKPDHRVRRYEHGATYVEVKPSADGLATVHDRDILIYCISQLMAAQNAGQPVSPVLRFKAHDLLKATNRMTNGQGYLALKAALERLAGTRISTNITTGGQEVFETFGIIERAKIVRETRDGRMQEVEVKLSDWAFNAIRHKEVLTLHRDYFRLRKPLERRIYEIARKHCGKQTEWKISLALLQKKVGSASTEKEFRRLVTSIVDEDIRHSHMPDYSVRLDEVITSCSKVVAACRPPSPHQSPSPSGHSIPTPITSPASPHPVGTSTTSNANGETGSPNAPATRTRRSWGSAGSGSRGAVHRFDPLATRDTRSS